MLSFALNYYFFQESVLSYKVINIAIHIANACLVFFLSLLVLRRTGFAPASERINIWAAFSIALLWALSPINLTSVLYLIQRMVSLGAFFALISLICWMTWRKILEAEGSFQVGLFLLFIVNFCLAILSKETYLLIGVVVYLFEWVLFRRVRPIEIHLARFQLALLVVLILVFLGVLVKSPEMIVGDYNQRNFSMYERVITQSRILIFYLQMIIAPSNLQLGLYHDGFLISKGLFEPVTTLFSIASLLVLLVAALIKVRANRLFSIGVFWYFGWHLLESSFISLELVHEHRNYLASLGVFWVVLFFFNATASRIQIRWLLPVIVTVLIIVNGGTTMLRAHEWSNLSEHALAEVIHHPGSVRARYQLGRIHVLIGYKERDVEQIEYAEEAFQKAVGMSDYDLLPFFGLIRARILLEKDIGEVVSELASRLEKNRVPVTTVVALSEILKCVKAGECDPLKKHYLKLVDSALRNQSFNDKAISEIYGLKASFYAEVQNDAESALVVLQDALARFPKDYMLRKGLLYYFLVNDRPKQAIGELKSFKQDFWHRKDARAVYKESCESLRARGYSPDCD